MPHFLVETFTQFPMYQVEESTQTNSVQVNMVTEEQAAQSYGIGEVVWGGLLLVGIFVVNISVLWVVSRSRELWKPRHLWMACLCITDIFVGAHKALELLIFALPYRELCVLQRATLGIPYVVNMLILSLLSLDRFIAVRYPFFYSANVSNKHVLIGFIIVLLTGGSLAAISITMGLRDSICRPQSLQLVYLTIVLTICSVITLFFNSSVLRIAKKQLNAIYAQEPSLSRGRRRVSVVCTNCGYKNETFVNTLLPIPVGSTSAGQNHGQLECLLPNGTSRLSSCNPPQQTSILPLADAVMIGSLDLDLNLKNYENSLEKGEMANGNNMHLGCEPDESASSHLADETTTPLVRTVSLPTIPDTVSVPISVVVQPDPAIRPAVVLGNLSADVGGGKMVSMSNLENGMNLPLANGIGGSTTITTSAVPPGSVVAGPHLLPRSRSLMMCRTHKILPPATAAPRLQLFRNLHFARTHMFHVGRLFPSIRFARTVLLIMIPMWVFILPIVTIIPLHRGCEDGNKSELNCELVDTLWRYLFVHMRSILPLQAILDTLIYAFGSKEFRQAVKKILRRFRQPKQ